MIAAMSDALPGRIAAFLAASSIPAGDVDVATFDRLALEAWAFQLDRIEPVRRLAAARGASPATIGSWRNVPPIPAAAFKSAILAAGVPLETFRSSGTTRGDEAASVHHHPYPDLYRAAIDASFARFCLPDLASPPMLLLVPPRALAPESSLSFMADHVATRHGGPASLWAWTEKGLDAKAARSWLGARQRDGRPVFVFATALALDRLVEALARLELRFRLPAGSVVFETGGFKGRERETTRDELLAGLADRLGIGAGRVVSEYGMTELTSQLYTRSLTGGAGDVFVPPPWVRVRVVDPETLAEVALGTPGALAIFDLANLGSAVHLLTDDLGVAAGDGVRLLGRASGAELRGCSLTAEERAG